MDYTVIINGKRFKNAVGQTMIWASEDGDVATVKNGQVKFPKPCYDRYGYVRYYYYPEKGKNAYIRGHRAVALAWLPKPEGKYVVNHVDGNKKNNALNNLEWCTSKDNLLHAIATGLNDPYVRREKVHVKDLITGEIKSYAGHRVMLKETGFTLSQLHNSLEKGYPYKNRYTYWRDGEEPSFTDDDFKKWLTTTRNGVVVIEDGWDKPYVFVNIGDICEVTTINKEGASSLVSQLLKGSRLRYEIKARKFNPDTDVGKIMVYEPGITKLTKLNLSPGYLCLVNPNGNYTVFEDTVYKIDRDMVPFRRDRLYNFDKLPGGFHAKVFCNIDKLHVWAQSISKA